MNLKDFEAKKPEVCEKCGQNKFIVSPDGIMVKCLCRCEIEAEKAADLAEKKRQHDLVLSQKRTCSLLGKRYANAMFDTVELDENNKLAYSVAKSYCDKYKEMLDKGYGFYVHGPVGTGKTHLIACVCNYLTDRLQDCAFTNFMNITNDIKRTYSTSESTENVIDKYSKIAFLFIDDLGKESYRKAVGDGAWLEEQLFLILNNRYNNMLPTIFSSNYSIDEFASSFGFDTAIVDRIKAMATKTLCLKGKNRRTEGFGE